MKVALAYSIEALYDILSHLDEAIWKSPLLLDKYYKSLCSYSHKQLSRLVDTRRLIVSIPKEKQAEVLHILCTIWYKMRKSYTIREIVELLGTLGDIIQITLFRKYLFITLQYSVFMALKFNTQFVFSSAKFTKFIKFIGSKDSKIARFLQSKVYKEI